MKYIWIIMLIMADIIWLIFSIKDVIKTYKFVNKHKRILFNDYMVWLETYTIDFIMFHLLCLFIYSLAVFIIGNFS